MLTRVTTCFGLGALALGFASAQSSTLASIVCGPVECFNDVVASGGWNLCNSEASLEAFTFPANSTCGFDDLISSCKCINISGAPTSTAAGSSSSTAASSSGDTSPTTAAASTTDTSSPIVTTTYTSTPTTYTTTTTSTRTTSSVSAAADNIGSSTTITSTILIIHTVSACPSSVLTCPFKAAHITVETILSTITVPCSTTSSPVGVKATSSSGVANSTVKYMVLTYTPATKSLPPTGTGGASTTKTTSKVLVQVTSGAGGVVRGVEMVAAAVGVVGALLL